MEKQKEREGGQFTHEVLKKGPGASPAQAHCHCSWGPSGALLRLPVRLMGCMDGIGGEADAARDLADMCTQNTSVATSLAAEHGGRFRAIQRQEKAGGQGHLRVSGAGHRSEAARRARKRKPTNNSVSKSGPS